MLVVSVGSGLESFGLVFVRYHGCGNLQHRDLGHARIILDLSTHFEARHVGKPHVKGHDFGQSRGQRQGGGAVAGFEAFIVRLSEDAAQYLPGLLLVIDNKDACWPVRHSDRLPGRRA